MSRSKKTSKSIVSLSLFSATLAPLLVLFLIFCWKFNLTQDDAFITFRYAENYINGHGLVWNIGERIEGYTNFLWLILIILFQNIGVGHLITVKVFGVVCSCATIILSSVFIRSLCSQISRKRFWIIVTTLSVSIFLVFNFALIYWTVAGLETPLFAFLCLTAFWMYYRRNWLIVPIITLAVLTRPEGAFLAVFFLLFRIIESRKIPKREIQIFALVALLLAPFAVFKWSYYGSIFPNSYYAKTVWDIEQLTFGLNYAWTFLKEYTLFGASIILIVTRYRRLPEAGRALSLFILLYAIYVIVIGGDVLKVNRFFVPILAPLYISVLMSLVSLRKWKIALPVFLFTALCAQIVLPYEQANAFRKSERGLIKIMNHTVVALQATDTSAFTLAASTIGMVGYALNKHIVYDMVGLTDSVVARHPQKPIDGMTTTWRERKYNAEYILAQAPDYILFSTGRKPSSPGERALFLYPAFLNNYRTVGFYSIETKQMIVIYKRMRDSLGPIERTVPVQFVQFYNRALNELNSHNYPEALHMLDSARAYNRDPIYPYIYYLKASCYAAIGRPRIWRKAVERSIELDSTLYESHAVMYRWLYKIPEERELALLHRSYVERLTPWYLRQLDLSVRGAR